MKLHLIGLLALTIALIEPVQALDLQATTVPGRAPSALSNGEIAINRADKRLIFKNIDGTLGFGSLLNAVPAGRKLVETGAADDATVGGVALPSALGAKAPVANPTFTGTLNAPAANFTGSGVAGPVDAATVGGVSMANRLAAVASSLPIVPGISASANDYACTTVANGSGLVLCPSNHDFVTGHGLRVNAIGNAFPSYTAPTLGTPTLIGNTPTPGTTTVYFAIVPTDGAQGYGTPSNVVSIANAPATRGAATAVRVPWTEGGSPAPGYIVCAGSSATVAAMKVVDFLQSGGGGGSADYRDYGHALPKQQDWLPANQMCPAAGPQRTAVHGLATVSGAYIDVGVGLPVAANTPVTVRHDNALPIRFALSTGTSSYRLPAGTYRMAVTNFSGSNVVLNGVCLYGAGRSSTIMQYTTAMIGTAGFNLKGSAPCMGSLTLDNGSDWSTQNSLAHVEAGTTAARMFDFSIPDIAKFGISDGGATDTVFEDFNLTMKVPDVYVGTAIAASNCRSLTVRRFRLKGAVPNTSCIGVSFDSFKITDWRSGSGIVTEQSAGSSDVSITNGEMASYAPNDHFDSNFTKATGLEIWSPRSRVSNVWIHDNPGGGISAGGKGSNYENITLSNNAGASINCRMDSPIYNCNGSSFDRIKQSNDDKTTYTTTYGYYTQNGSTNNKSDARIGAGNTFVGTIAKIDTGTLTGSEIFTSTTSTPPAN